MSSNYNIDFEGLDEANVSVKFGFVPSPPTEYSHDILIIKYDGVYPIGSAGKSDAKYMHAMGIAGIDRYSPSALIIDLSSLHYEWGDDLDYSFDLSSGRKSSETVFVVLSHQVS